MSAAEVTSKRRSIHKQNAKNNFMQTLFKLESRKIKPVYTGSSKWHNAKGYIGGYGIFVKHELEMGLGKPTRQLHCLP